MLDLETDVSRYHVSVSTTECFPTTAESSLVQSFISILAAALTPHVATDDC